LFIFALSSEIRRLHEKLQAGLYRLSARDDGTDEIWRFLLRSLHVPHVKTAGNALGLTGGADGTEVATMTYSRLKIGGFWSPQFFRGESKFRLTFLQQDAHLARVDMSTFSRSQHDNNFCATPRVFSLVMEGTVADLYADGHAHRPRETCLTSSCILITLCRSEIINPGEASTPSCSF